MKNQLSFIQSLGVGAIAIIILGGLTQLFFDWWIIALVAFLVALYLNQSGLKSWAFGFVGVFVLWSAFATYLNMQNGGLLSAKMAELLAQGKVTGTNLVYLTGFIGGVVGGFSALSGSLARKIVVPK